MIYFLIAIGWAIISTGYCIYLQIHRLSIAAINSETYRQNEELDHNLQRKRSELQDISRQIQNSNSILASLKTTAKEMREGAEQQACERAEVAFSAKMKELNNYFEQKGSEAKSKLDITLAKVKEEEQKLQSLEAKQLAYIQAQQRQEEIESNRDYYRLAIDIIDVNDIELLRELQRRFTKKESIDKLIWESYYKPAFDILISHTIPDSNHKVSGIYKITDLTTNQAYIGQSVDIKERWRTHIKTSLTYGPATNKLYQTMKKSGQYNFTFEILERVPKEQLNEREVYWIEFYKTKEFGLNGTKGGA